MSDADLSWIDEARAMHGIPVIDEKTDPKPDASDPASGRRAARTQRVAERSVATTIAEMMSVIEVRAVIYRWLWAMRAFEAHDFPFGQAIDPLQLARNAAHREIAQFILADLHRSAPEQYLAMLRENQVAAG